MASGFNCLEFVDACGRPEDGVSGYEHDRTQGPACSIACGPATVYRNYFVPVTLGSPKPAGGDLDGTCAVAQQTQEGQTVQCMLNGLDELLAAVDVPEQFMSVRAGVWGVSMFVAFLG